MSDLSDFLSHDFAIKSKFKWDFHIHYSNAHLWKKISSQYDAWRSGGGPGDIPKIIHQIWIGGPLPTAYKKWTESWKKVNPTYEYKLWTDPELLKIGLANHDLYKKTENLGAKSDIARYELLYKFGGIYVDTDFECIKSFDDLLNTSFFIGHGFDYSPQIFTGIIGAEKGNLVLEKVIREINISPQTNDPIAILNSTGSKAFTKIFFDALNSFEHRGVVLPSDYFYPWPNFLLSDEKNRYKYLTADTYAIHHWQTSWIKPSLLVSAYKRFNKCII